MGKKRTKGGGSVKLPSNDSYPAGRKRPVKAIPLSMRSLFQKRPFSRHTLTLTVRKHSSLKGTDVTNEPRRRIGRITKKNPSGETVTPRAVLRKTNQSDKPGFLYRWCLTFALGKKHTRKRGGRSKKEEKKKNQSNVRNLPIAEKKPNLLIKTPTFGKTRNTGAARIGSAGEISILELRRSTITISGQVFFSARVHGQHVY